MNFNVYAKSIVGAIMAGLAVLLVSVDADSAGGSGIVSSEWIRCVIAVVATFGVVWGVPNKITAGQVAEYLAKQQILKQRPPLRENISSDEE